jgi:hypothetical protein
MRTRNIALIVISVACLAAMLYLFVERGSATVHPDVDPAPAKTNDAPAAQPVQRARVVDATSQPEVQAAETLASPPLDSATIAHCHWAFVDSRPIKTPYCENPKTSLGMHQCQESEVTDALKIQTMRGEAAACPSSLASASGYYDALRAAAQAGDVGAQRCFIQGYFDDIYHGNYISAQQRKDYVALAKEYISSGLQRGDWSLVDWLARLAHHIEDGQLHTAYPIGSDETLYKMNFLLTLGGATDTITQRPQSIVRNVGAMLSNQQIEQAQEWARDTYSKYFAATPYVHTPVTSFCATSVP